MNKEQLFRFGLAVLLLTVIITGYGGLCKKKSDDDDVIITGSSGLSGWTVTNNPSNSSDMPYSVAVDDDYVYIVGYDTEPNIEWRLEKRYKANGSLVTDFGPYNSGVITTNPSADVDLARTVALDGDHLYTIGYDKSPGGGSAQWRIEKRHKVSGTLVAGFGLVIDGVVTSNLTSRADDAGFIAIDNDYIYVAGDEKYALNDYQWRIEKRHKVTGTLVTDTDFGVAIAGAVTSRPTTAARIYDMASDSDYLYIAGMDNPGNGQWRVEKRHKISGTLVAGFGLAIDGVVTSNPTVQHEYPYAIAADGDYFYVAGYEGPAAGDSYWRIEKRHKVTGTLVTGFGINNSGVITGNHGVDRDIAYSIIVDGDYLYIGGYDTGSGAGNYQWRIEKRSKTDGQLVTSFDTDGIVTINPSANDDRIWAMTTDSEFIYAVGVDFFPTNYQWRIEKLIKSTGGQ